MKKTVYCGVLVALALIFSYIEVLFPLPIAVPGIKLGLANIVILFALYRMGEGYAVSISIVRVILAGVLFSNMASVMYSLAGAIAALVAMYLAKRLGLHVITVSIIGAILHILGQLLVAGMVTSFAAVSYYLPYLLVAALVTGTVIGALGSQLIDRIPIDTY